MKYSYCIIAIATLSMIACKKNKTDTQNSTIPNEKVYENYMPVKQGSYWIYQHYTLDSINGAEHAENSFDSCYVLNDTVISGKTYHHTITQSISKNAPPDVSENIFRDSLSYIVNQKGEIRFSSEDFNTVFKSYTYGPNQATPDTLQVVEVMGFKNITNTVPAGTFTTSSFRQIFSYKKIDKTQIENRYSYAKNIGLVRYTRGVYIYSKMVLENRLVRYNLQ